VDELSEPVSHDRVIVDEKNALQGR
jgi:hypothetical protein